MVATPARATDMHELLPRRSWGLGLGRGGAVGVSFLVSGMVPVPPPPPRCVLSESLTVRRQLVAFLQRALENSRTTPLQPPSSPRSPVPTDPAPWPLRSPPELRELARAPVAPDSSPRATGVFPLSADHPHGAELPWARGDNEPEGLAESGSVTKRFRRTAPATFGVLCGFRAAAPDSVPRLFIPSCFSAWAGRPACGRGHRRVRVSHTGDAGDDSYSSTGSSSTVYGELTIWLSLNPHGPCVLFPVL